jgi:hypothetical protein
MKGEGSLVAYQQIALFKFESLRFDPHLDASASLCSYIKKSSTQGNVCLDF